MLVKIIILKKVLKLIIPQEEGAVHKLCRI